VTDNRNLMLRAAWAHLVEGRTQESVAREFGLTRAKTNRLISECREAGLVRVGIATEARLALHEERELKRRFDLVDVWVVPDAQTEDGALRSVGAAAGAFVSEQLGPGETLAIGWGRTLSASLAGLQPRKAQGNRVVTLLGGMVVGDGLNSYDIASRYARTIAATCCYLIAPRMTDTVDAAAFLRDQPHVREALRIAEEADMILVGADDLSPESTLYITGQLTAEDIADLVGAGAVCTLQGEALRRDGTPIGHRLAARTVGIDLQSFRLVSRRVVCATGLRKAEGIAALLRGGFCNVLITDERTAIAVLAAASG